MTNVNITEDTYQVTVTEGATQLVTVKAPGPQGPGFPDGNLGDVTSSNTGASVVVNSGAITNAKVNDSAAIAGTKISPNFGSQNITTTGNAVFGGNLTVSGSVTTIDTTTLRVEDKNIELGKVGSPTDITADGGGITLLGDTNHTFNWLNATDSWTSSEHIALPDNKKLQLGDSQDYFIKHDPSMFGGVYNRLESTNGNVWFVNTDTTNKFMYIRSGDIQLRDWVNNKAFIHCDSADLGVDLFFNGIKRFETTNEGISVSGDGQFYGFTSGRNLKWDASEDRLAADDNTKIVFGNSQDLTIFHNSTDSFIENITGNLHIRPKASEEGIILIPDDGVKLHHNGDLRLFTRSWGVAGFGTFQANNIEASSGYVWAKADNQPVKVGVGGDLSILHNGTDSKITNITGNLLIEAKASQTAIKVIPDGATEIYHSGVKKAETVSTGLDVDGNVIANNLIVANGISHEGQTNTNIAFDGTQIKFQSNGVQRFKITQFAAFVTAGYKLAFVASSGENPTIKSGGTNNGDLLIESGTASMAQFKRNAAVELYHNGTKKAESSSTGWDVTGAVKASTGILFGSDTAAANTLDDYEEGTFTPTLEGTSSNPTVNYHFRSGHYTKIGNVVHVQIVVIHDSYTGGSGEWQCGGLPFTSSSTATASYNFNWNQNNRVGWGTGHLSLGIYVSSNTNRFRGRRFASNINNPLNLNSFSNSQRCVFGIHGSYIAA